MHLENRLTVCGADNDRGPLVFVVAYQVRDYGLLIGPITLATNARLGSYISPATAFRPAGMQDGN